MCLSSPIVHCIHKLFSLPFSMRKKKHETEGKITYNGGWKMVQSSHKKRRQSLQTTNITSSKTIPQKIKISSRKMQNIFAFVFIVYCCFSKFFYEAWSLQRISLRKLYQALPVSITYTNEDFNMLICSWFLHMEQNREKSKAPPDKGEKNIIKHVALIHPWDQSRREKEKKNNNKL